MTQTTKQKRSYPVTLDEVCRRARQPLHKQYNSLKPPSKATETTLMMKCINVSIYNRFMLIVLFDVIYCLTVTSKHSQLHANGKQIKWYFHCSTMETNWKQKKTGEASKQVACRQRTTCGCDSTKPLKVSLLSELRLDGKREKETEKRSDRNRYGSSIG